MKVNYKMRGDFSKASKDLEETLSRLKGNSPVFKEIGEKAVQELASNTPYRTGETSRSWKYKVETKGSNSELSFYNNAHATEVNGLIHMLEYGHSTKNGGYVPGRHFVEKSMKTINEEFSKKVEAIERGSTHR